ncbi:putative secreted protein (Por secretion system target) [Mucilaginibacter frigoritolerans]|uniref:Putative secreted protein (Por secretion system target) n=2 Tax=Mucilaginibacter frigoritolerans TaxID=652788 RepID=A0A562U6W2_9SPHI|nr:putative secreted protein (Por secretion system target) [Mucilaginibacter frigoritolerans]
MFNNTAGATTYIWNGGASGSWTTASNWLPNTGYPGQSATDVASFITSNVTVTLPSTITIASMNTAFYGISGITVNVNSGSTLNISGGITTAQASSAANGFTFSGAGTTKISGTITAGYQASLTIASGATVYLNANAIADWSNSQSTITNNGTLNIQSGCTFKFGYSSYMVNSGTVNSNASTYNFTGGSSNYSINNTGAFTDHKSSFNITGQNVTLNNSGSGNFHGSGTTISDSTNGSNSFSINNSSATSIMKLDSGSFIKLYQQTDAINNTGFFYVGTSNSSCLLTMKGQSSYIANTGTFSVGSTSIISPYGTSVTITNTSPGTFTFQSDQYGTASLLAMASTSSTTGIFNVQRYLSGGTLKIGTRWVYRNYRLMSSPVNTFSVNTGLANQYGINLQYLANSAIVTGAKGGYAFPSTFNSSTAYGNPTIYFFREDITPSNASFTGANFTGVTDLTQATTIGLSDGTSPKVSVGNGFFFFFRGDRINNVGTNPGKTTSPFVAPEGVVFTANGYLNQQSYQVQNWVVGGGSLKYETNPTYNGISENNAAVRGFNLIGNPYPCSVDWETYATSGATGIVVNTTSGVPNVAPTIWVFNPFTNQYNTYMKGDGGVGKGLNGTATGNTSANIIASGQGFFVMAVNHASTITFTESAKTSKQPSSSYLLMGAPPTTNVSQYMRLVLQTDSVNNDDMLVFFKSTASTGYNPMEDAKYFPGMSALESLASISSDSVKLAINRLPFPNQKAPLTIRLSANVATSGQYTLKRYELQSVPQLYEVWLMDKYKKDSLDLRANTNYVFNVVLTDTASFGNNRFSIVIRQNPALGVHLLSFAATKETSGSEVVWKTENEENYTNFTVQRSTDGGVTFVTIGGVSSSSLSTYSFLDKNPVAGADIYRLAITDLNGTTTYSNTVKLIYGNATNVAASNLSVYPNPSNGIINLSIQGSNSTTNSSGLSLLQSVSSTPTLASTSTTSSSYAIKIISLAGAVVKTATSSTINWQDNVSNLAPGTYIIQVVNNSNQSLVGRSTFVKL